MSEPLNRREFLRLLGGGALVLGLGDLARADDRAEEAAWRAALERMRARGAHGVAVVVPSDPAAREALGQHLQARLPVIQAHDAAPPIALWLLETVWVCASPARAQAQPGETLVLLDPQGKRVSGAAVDLGDAAAFERGVEALLAPGLEARAQAQTTPELAEALAGLPARESAYALLRRADDAPSVAVHVARTTQDPDTRELLLRSLGQAYWDLLRRPAGLPFGAAWELEVTEPAPCPPCGMARPSLDGRRFLDFFPPA